LTEERHSEAEGSGLLGRTFVALCLVYFLNSFFITPFSAIFPVYVETDLERLPWFTGYLRGLMLVSGEPEKYAVTGNYLSYDPYALMMRRDDSAFRLLVDRTLADLFFRKEFDNLFDKWFKPMGVPMNDVLKAAMTIQMHVN